MAFQVFPTTLDKPLKIPAGKINDVTNTLIDIPVFLGTDSASEPGIPATNIANTMFIRMAMLGPTPAIANQPTVFLQARSGANAPGNATEITAIFGGTPTNIPDGVNQAGAADANRFLPDANNVYLVKVFVSAVGDTFKMGIKNNDVVDHEFTWVIADSLADSRQPWIDILPPTIPPGVLTAQLNFDALVSQSPPPVLSLPVANKGTGSLSITGATGTVAEFTPTLPLAVPPNSSGAATNLQIAFNPPAAIGQTAPVNYLFVSNDTTAQQAGGHNRMVQLSGTTRQLEIALMLDASGSMAYMPNGSATVPDPNESRWGRLKQASRQFLDLLGPLASSQGRFAIGMFPDITNINQQCPVPSPSAADIQVPIDISSGAISTAKNLLDNHTPVQNCAATPIGFGIGRAMGTTPTGFGYFLGSGVPNDPPVQFNKRFLVLMSDGANNSNPPDPTVFYGNGSTSFKAKKIKVITVAYGEETGTPFEVDHTLLKTISAQSAADSTEAATLALDAGADDAGLNLRKSFRQAITAGLSLDPTTDPGGFLTPWAPEARHQVSINKYDTRAAFVVDWRQFNPERVSVSILTPLCELITPGWAAQDPNITFSGESTYAVYTFNNDFLRNAADPAHPRYGNWTLIIAGNGLGSPDDGGTIGSVGLTDVSLVGGLTGLGLAGGLTDFSRFDFEPYQYEVITDSRIKLRPRADRATYYAGDPIKLTATLDVDGKGIPNATVTLFFTRPGQSPINWLALSRVTADEFARSAEILKGEVEAGRLGIKAHALAQKGSTFDAFKITTPIPMIDEAGTGVYTATASETSVTGAHDLYVVATGETADGVSFRREQRLGFPLEALPDPKFTLFDIAYRLEWVGDEQFQVADVTAHTRDRFGNVTLVDDNSSRVAITARGGEFSSPLVSNLDGSYSRSIRYRPGNRPVLGLVVDDQPVVTDQRTVPFEALYYTDKVLDYQPGGEADQGANQHTDPSAILGNPTEKDQGVFVALGAFGSITVGVEGHVILAQGSDDVTVFIEPGDLRSYRVEAQPVGRDHWVLLGTSRGGTQSFSLKQGKLKRAQAVRITDESGAIRDAFLQPLWNPGACPDGVGFKKTAEYIPSEPPDDPLSACLEAVCEFVTDLLGGGEGRRAG